MADNPLTRKEFEALLQNRFKKRADWLGLAKTAPEGQWVCFGYGGLGQNVYTQVGEDTYFMPWVNELIETGMLLPASSPKYCYELGKDIVEYTWADNRGNN